MLKHIKIDIIPYKNPSFIETKSVAFAIHCWKLTDKKIIVQGDCNFTEYGE